MKKDKKDIKKIVLAYSGGLDTSVMIPWLKENYPGCEVIAVTGDVGQNDELEGLEEKAIATGASKYYAMDLKDEFVEDYIKTVSKIPTMSFHKAFSILLCSSNSFSKFFEEKTAAHR